MFWSDSARAIQKFWWTLKKSERSQSLNAIWEALPNRQSKPWHEYRYLCVDLEFSDLNAQKGDILSIGWVEIDNGKVLLSTARHLYLKSRKTVGQSATIHNIRDCDVNEGLTVAEAAEIFLRACKGRVLVLHHGVLDFSYLNKAAKRLYGSALRLPYCDTLQLEKTKLLNGMGTIPAGALTLANCRARYGLPGYTQHNALVDALATAELFIAHLAYRDPNLTLKHIRFA